MYAKYSGLDKQKLKAHHHVRLDAEFKFDCEVWRLFLTHYHENRYADPWLI